VVSRPPSCWRLTRSGPPSSSASSSRRRSSSISDCQSLRDAPSIAPCVPIPASVHGDEDAVARLAVERLGAMPLAPRVLDEEHFAGADAARLAVTRGDLHARVEIDDVLPPRGSERGGGWGAMSGPPIPSRNDISGWNRRSKAPLVTTAVAALIAANQ